MSATKNTQEQNVQNNQAEKKKWEDYTLAEKKESYLKLMLKEIAESIKNGYAPFTQEVQNLSKPYNGSNGLPYTNLNSLMLDIKKKQYGYEDNIWISLNDARFLKASEEEIKSIFNNKEIPKAQVSYIKTFKIEFVYQLDKDGNKIPMLDQNGNQLMNKNGKPLFKIATEPQLDKDGIPKLNSKTGEPYFRYVSKKIPIDPTLETTFLYNIKEFKTIDRSRIKPLNQEQEYKNFIHHSKDFDSSNSFLIFQDIEKNLRDHTAGQIISYLKAQNNNTSYVPPVSLNETQKIQAQRSAEAVVEKILEERGLLKTEEKKEQKNKDTPKQTTKKPKEQEQEPKKNKGIGR